MRSIILSLVIIFGAIGGLVTKEYQPVCASPQLLYYFTLALETGDMELINKFKGSCGFVLGGLEATLLEEGDLDGFKWTKVRLKSLDSDDTALFYMLPNSLREEKAKEPEEESEKVTT